VHLRLSLVRKRGGNEDLDEVFSFEGEPECIDAWPNLILRMISGR